MKHEIRNRLTGAVQFMAEIVCTEDAPTSLKAGLAVRWALNNGANLSGADLSGADLYRANLSGANLSGADLYGADLRGANLYRADLYGADLYGADLRGANLYRANLSGANLSGADLSGADLSGADLYRADLSGANLSGADLYGADLRGANLYGANLYGADLYGVDLSGAISIEDRIIDGGLRADGYRFYLILVSEGERRIRAGCRDFTVAEGQAHWRETRGGTPLGDETFALIDHMQRIADMRGWPE